MPINFRCPHCRHVLSAPDNLAGIAGECMLCRQPFIVPMQPTVVGGAGTAAAPGSLTVGQSGSPDAAALPTAEPIRFAGAAKHDDRSQRGPSRHAKPFKFIEPLYRNFGAKLTSVLALLAVSGIALFLACVFAWGWGAFASSFAGHAVNSSPRLLGVGVPSALVMMVLFLPLFVCVAIWFTVAFLTIALARMSLGRRGSLRTDIFSASALFWIVLGGIIVATATAALSAPSVVVNGPILYLMVLLRIMMPLLMFRVVFESLRDLAQVPPWQAAVAAIGVLLATAAFAVVWALGIWVAFLAR